VWHMKEEENNTLFSASKLNAETFSCVYKIRSFCPVELISQIQRSSNETKVGEFEGWT
jgi:hypothetical protein